MVQIYAAAGQLYMNEKQGKYFPFVVSNLQEYQLTVREMRIWSILASGVYLYSELKEKFFKNDWQEISEQQFKDTLNRLIVRGIVIVGQEQTVKEAFYDLMQYVCIIPIKETLWIRIKSFLFFTFMKHMPLTLTIGSFKKDRYTPVEQSIMKLAQQSRFCTGEMIKRTEISMKNVENSEEKISFENLSEFIKKSEKRQDIVKAIYDLYIKGSIYFDKASVC